MIPIKQEHYFTTLINNPALTAEMRAAADLLLIRVNTLLARAERDGVPMTINPKTGSLISGNGAGGWRLPNATVGAPMSSHKEGRGIDIYDPHDGAMDHWCMQNQVDLVEIGLYMEHPAATPGWCHLTTRAPGSGSRVFYP